MSYRRDQHLKNRFSIRIECLVNPVVDNYYISFVTLSGQTVPGMSQKKLKNIFEFRSSLSFYTSGFL